MSAATPATAQLAAQLTQASAEIVKWYERTLELEGEIAAMRRREQVTVIVKRNTWPDSPEQLADAAAHREWAAWQSSPDAEPGKRKTER